jgi:hypothetical protein
MLSMMTP